jgi:hypothetical protein
MAQEVRKKMFLSKEEREMDEGYLAKKYEEFKQV